jgi:predicted nucleic acid-binding protein
MPRLALVDSTIFIGLIRAGIDPIRELVAHLPFATWATCGIVRLEVLRGMKSPIAKRALEDFFDAVVEAPTNLEVWRDATALAAVLDRRGIILPAADLVIAACARAIGAALLSSDQHFRQIPGLQVFSSPNEFRQQR